jgi:hypothetical protein
MVLQFIIALNSICNRNFCFMNQNVFLNIAEIFKNKQSLELLNLGFCLPFQSCPL